jgi:Flp pilus assembly protein protease CpaA
MIKDALLLTVFPAAMAFAAAQDLITMTVPNRIAIVLVAGFFALAPLVGLGWTDIGWHLLAGMAAFLVAFGCFAMGWIGGGDAKLFGGALTFAILFMRRMPLPIGPCRPRLARPAPRCQGGRALRHRARGGGAARLPGHSLHACARRLRPLAL